MLDPAISTFLEERKQAWLKKKIKSETTDEEKLSLEEQAAKDFSLTGWLPDAARRAKQLSMVSHPGKFSHPSAKVSSIIATGPRQADGFLRSGNVEAELDVLGNAAALDVYKFLSLEMADGATVLTHVEKATPASKEQFADCPVAYDEIRQELLAIKQSDETTISTSSKVKQVFFPVAEREYHLLSVLTPSSLMFQMKDRIRALHFSETTKEAREAKKSRSFHEAGFSELFGLSVIGYGGTKPQNISVLNNQHGGAAYLLPSCPPVLADRKIQPPRRDFFSDSLWLRFFKDDFQKFHDQLALDRNNIHVRNKRDWLIRAIIYQVADRLWTMRSLESGWSASENYVNLPRHHKIWLDQVYLETREKEPQWFEEIQKDLARWFVRYYRKVQPQSDISLGDDELPHIKKMIAECEEALR